MLRKKLLSIALAASLLMGQAAVAIGPNRAQAAQTEPDFTLVYETDYASAEAVDWGGDVKSAVLEDGALRMETSGGQGVVWDNEAPQELENGAVEIEFKSEDPGSIGIAFRTTNNTAGNYLFAGTRDNKETILANGYVNTMLSTTLSPLSADSYHTMRVEFVGEKVGLWIDGEKIGEATQLYTGAIPVNPGKIGLRIYKTSQEKPVYIKSLKVFETEAIEEPDEPVYPDGTYVADFTADPQWTNAIEGSVLEGKYTFTAAAGSSVLDQNAPNMSDGVYRYRFSSGSDKVGVVFGGSTKIYHAGDGAWYLQADAEAPVLLTEQGPIPNAEIEHILRVDCVGGKFSVWLDNETVSSEYSWTGAAGQPGFYNPGDEDIRITVSEFTARQLTSYSNDFDDSSAPLNWSDNSKVSYDDGKLFIQPSAGVVYDLDSPDIADAMIEFDATPVGDVVQRMGFGFRMNSSTAGDYAFAGIDTTDEWRVANGSNYTAFPQHYEPVPNEEMHIKIVIEGYSTELFINGESLGVVTKNNIPDSGHFGVRLWGSATGLLIDNLQISELTSFQPEKPTAEKINTISSDQMTVSIDEYFPRVKSYVMADGRVMDGRLNPINALIVNDAQQIAVNPSNVEFTKVSDSEAEYKLHIKVDDVDSTVTARFKVEGNILSFDITEVQNSGAENINYLEIPEWSLVSVNNKDGSVSEFEGARMSENVDNIGDTNIVIDENYVATESETDWLYAFVSNEESSAAIYSNSENNSFRRIVASSYTVTEGEESYAAMGLGSARWVIQDPEMDTQNTVMPSTKVIITGDANANGEINWQDGAIAVREIMENPQGWEEVANQVSVRITHNVSSLAANPFLTALDNTKKVYLSTDGLGQKVLMKGYGGEGHDSNHSDYGYVGKRIGGVEYFNTLIEEGAKYGAAYGVHINATETYPEAATFDPEYLRGNQPNPMGKPYGWSWFDSSYYIDTFKDYVSGSRMNRLQSLKDQVPGINFIYVDVWYAGDQMSDSGGAWESVKFAEEINSLGWTLATEWAHSFEGDSTFSHWATDMNYGGKTTKGINSQVIRFIANHQRDTWMANYPQNGGTMVGPLLGGADMKGFEGWQGRHNYGEFIRTTFNTNLPTKFLQHYTVSSWENFEDGTEKEIQLVNEDNSQKIVVSRGEMPEGSTANGTRVMTLNGKTVLIDNQEIVNGTSTPHTSYLLPWYWTEGELNANDTERLYHYNSDGGETTWDMPAGWENVTTVKLYKLTDQGKTEETTLPVNGGKVTINAEPETPYVLYKEAVAQSEVEYGTGTHMIDPGFTSGNLDAWEVEGDGASIDGMDDYSSNIQAQNGNDRLMIAGNTTTTTVSQTLSGLTPGQEYTAMVYVQNDAQDAKASLSVNAGGKVEEAYTYQSIATVVAGPDPHKHTYMQRMYVHFTAPADGSAVTLTLSREAAEEAAYFDDVRIIEDDVDNWVNDDLFVQDFEDNKPSIYPFVHAPGDGSFFTHRSERNDPYTQRGWTWEETGVTTLIDDVINGDWGLKFHVGTNKCTGVIFKTIPQNVRFEAGETYHISFKYEFVTEGEYQIAIGNGESNEIQLIPLETTPDGYKTANFTVTGDENGQTWFGIYSQTTDANRTDADAAAGRHDFVMDDLIISKVKEVDKSTLGYVLQLAQVHVDNGDVDNLIPAAKEQFEKTMAEAQAIYDDPDSTQEQVDQAWKKLLLVIQAMDFVPGDKTELAELIVQAQNMDLNQYEDGAEKEAFETALQEAVELLADPNAMANDITAAYDKLEAAMQALIPLPEAGDKTELKKAIDIANGHDLSKYVDDANKTNFLTVLEQAEAVYADEAATQDEIDEAWRNLLDAMTALRLRADKDNLNDWLDELKSIDLSQYTEESAAAVRAAIANAEALASQDLGTDQEPLIRIAIAQMQLAKENLVLKDNNPGDSNSSGKPADSSSGSDANAGSDPAKTGDSAPIAAISVMAVAVAGTLWMLRKRKD